MLDNHPRPRQNPAMRGALAFLLVLSACGSRTQLPEGTPAALALDASPDVGATRDAATVDAAVIDAGCAAACSAGQVCIHSYYTHDPPPPLPDGGICTYGTQRYHRCWSVMDRCGVIPKGCVAGPSCSCPSLGPPNWPEGCECHGDGSFDCYSIGI